ncbi:MAG TPA: hypothetical protein PK961_11120 [bacterium]|nr:hypothetical protein [bacterium]
MPRIATEEQHAFLPRTAVFLAATLVGAFCFAVQWLPLLLVIAVFIFPLPWIAAALLGFTLLRNALRLRVPRLVKAAGWMYYPVASLWALALARYVSFIDPMFAVLTVVYALALAYVLAVHERKRWLLALFAIPPLVALYLLPDTPMERLSVVLTVVLLPGMLLLDVRTIGRAALFYAAVLAMLILRLSHFYYGGNPDLAAQVYTQPNVQRIVSLDQGPPETLAALGRQLRFAADNMPGTSTILGGDAATVAVDPLGHGPQVIIEGRSADAMTYDPQGRRMIIAGYETNEFVTLDDATLQERTRERLPGRAFTNLWCDQTHRLVFTGDDFTRDIGVYSLPESRFTAFLPAGASSDAMIDNRTGLLIASRWCFVRWIDAHRGETVRKLFVPDVHLHMAMDEARRKLYVSAPSTGRIWRINLDNGLVELRAEVEKGVRYLTLSDDGRWLFAAGYFQGNLYQLDASNLSVVRRLYAGPRVRTLHIAPGSGKVLFTSSLGAFRYDFAAQLPQFQFHP